LALNRALRTTRPAGRQLSANTLGGGSITLNLSQLADLGEFLGGIFVVFSLVYLAIQIRQNTQSNRAENFARGLERISEMQATLSRDPELASLHARGVADASSLTPQERIRFTWWFAEAFGAFEFLFHQSKTGAIPDEIWERWSQTVAWWLSYPGVQAWWRAHPAPFSHSFTRFVDELVSEGQFDVASTARWQEFVSGSPVAMDSPAAQKSVEPDAE
jgi:hypothetical protein